MSRLLGLKQVPVFVETGDAKVTTEFGKNIPDYPTAGKTGNHYGLDLVRCSDGKSSELATVCAIADGVIYAQRKWVKGFDKNISAGNCVYIRHKNGMISKYMHFKYDTVPDWVKDDAPVKKGQVIGYMGSTGYSYGAHLHFQVEDKNGNPVDPEPYLKGEKLIDEDEKIYTVEIGAFEKKAEAEKIQAALKVLGTDSVIKTK